MMSISPSAFTS